MRVDEMEAGRELDALVAEKVMGWEYEARSLFRPSQDIAAAWEVVEKLKMCCGYSHGRGDPFAMLECEKFSTLVVCADTVSLAICRAALKAVGIEEVRRSDVLA